MPRALQAERIMAGPIASAERTPVVWLVATSEIEPIAENSEMVHA